MLSEAIAEQKASEEGGAESARTEGEERRVGSRR